jgi:hypothetical protein
MIISPFFALRSDNIKATDDDDNNNNNHVEAPAIAGLINLAHEIELT